MKQLAPWLAKHSQTKQVPILDLDAPAELKALDSQTDPGRIAVAWGLSYPTIDIGDLRSPSEIPDIPRPPYRDIYDSFVSKDSV